MARSSNTTGNNKKKGEIPPQLKGKGFDAHPERINKKGRPKSFDQLRALFQDIASETIEIQGKKYTRAQAIGIAMSMDKKHMREFLEFAFGKVPDKVEGTGEGGAILIKFIDETIKKSDDKDD